MTTIAYRSGIMCSDSQLTGDNVRDVEMQKMRLIDGYAVGVAGKAGAIQEFMQWFEQNKAQWPLRLPDTLKQDSDDYPITVLVVKGKKMWMADGVGFPYEVTAPYTAIGSGRQFALGAMAMGADAQKAIQVAAKHDIYTGGRVKVLKLTSTPRHC